METGLNLSSLSVDKNGRVTLSGLVTGLDVTATVDAMIAARRIPVDRMEAQVLTNKNKIAAFQEIRDLLNSLQNSLSKLFGAVTVDSAGDSFQTKEAFASTSRVDGASPAAAANLVGVSVGNAAALGTHTIDVQRTAKAHKVSSDTVVDPTAAFGSAGTFTINGQSITVAATDTLQDIRDLINNANTGTNATKVSASIVAVSATQNFLILTADETGSTMTFADTTNTPLADLGILTGAAIKNELQVAETAQFFADGLLDQTDSIYESNFQSSATTQIGSNGTLTFAGGVGPVGIAYTSGQTLTTLAANITADPTLAAANISAAVVQDGAGVRLEITDADGDSFTITETGGGSAITDLGINNKRILIERTSNTVNDLFNGITLTLFQAEPGTTIKIDIDRNLTTVKSQIQGFVTAYNDVKSVINLHRQGDPETGEAAETAGALFGDTTLGDIESRLSSMFALGVQGVDTGFATLAQIGITFVNNSTLSDPLLEDTLEIDDAKIDEALLNNPDDVRRLFSFDFSSSDPRVSLLSFTGQTSFNATGYKLNVSNIGPGVEISQGTAVDADALLSDGVDGFGATGSGSFTINGTAIAYDLDGVGGDDDSLTDLAATINGAAINGITAIVITDSAGEFQLQINSTVDILTVVNVSGDLLGLLNFQVEADLLATTDIDGVANSTTVSSRTITVTDQTGAEGLKLFYSGSDDLTNVQLDFTVGFGAQMFFEIGQLLDLTTGIVETEIDTLEARNKLSQSKIDSTLKRLDFQRERLLERFFRLEQILATFDRISASITSITDGMFANN